MCIAECCPFRVHASPAPDSSMFVIKTFTNKHTCQVLKKNKMVSSTWIASRLLNNFKDCLDLDVKGIRSILRERYIIFAPTIKFYRARRKAEGNTMETHKDEFIIVRCYALMVFLKPILTVFP